MDTHTIIDIIALLVSVVGSHLATIRTIEKRLRIIETQIAIVLDRDRRNRKEDYNETESS